ncbi:hypothetical protein [Streptomyces sp. PvR034]|uniref:RICIN domain-containing protein n=1 Tax=Streptomyces sp. PvR034 TaxID=3156401 RepID=UPI003394B271
MLVSAALVLASATGAQADGKHTWRHKTSGDCLFFAYDGNPTPVDVGIHGCGFNDLWDEQYNANDDTYLMHPGNKSGSCLAAYSNDDVYVEPCTPNNDWQRWYQRWTGTHWKLQHKQTGRYLDSNDSSVYLGPGGWNNDNKYQLWY